MTTLTPDASDLVHAVSFYGSDREWLDVCVPFCEAGLAGDEPVFAILSPPHAELLQTTLAEPDRVVFVPREAQYTHPPGALRALRDQVVDHASGATPVRLLGEPPTPDGLAGDSWIRYEAAINHVVGDRSARGLCVYAAGELSPEVQAELQRAHPMVVTPDGGPHPNADYLPPEALAADRLVTASDPLEDHPAAINLTDPDVATVRHVVSDLARTVGLATSDTDNLVLAVSEVATNAVVHGRPPVRVRGWGVPARVAVAVSDTGAGPADPLAGLRPASVAGEHGGFGLWVAYQVCPEIAMATSQDGFTVRLAAGSVEPGPPARH